jgi:glutamyl-Q tRNA(Asp) synthetase
VLGYSTPKYAHIPVASNQAGEKLSKQTLATPIDANNAPNLLINALDFLGQTPPQDLSNYKAQEILAWAMQHWALDKIPKQRSIIFE